MQRENMKYARILPPARTKTSRLKADGGPACYERLPEDRQSLRRTNAPVHTVFPVGMLKCAPATDYWGLAGGVVSIWTAGVWSAFPVSTQTTPRLPFESSD